MKQTHLLLAAIALALFTPLLALKAAPLLPQEPRLYTPSGVDAAYLEKIRTQTAPLMTMSEQELRTLVPTSAGIRWLTCPHCKIRSRTANWKWSINDPHHIVCQDCNTRFPDNPTYPYDGKDIVDGNAYPYYTEKGVRYHFSLAADWLRKEYLMASARDLAELYAQTGDEQYARTSLAILDEFASKFPRYPVIANGMWVDKPTEITAFPLPKGYKSPGGTDHARATVRWSFWRYMDLSREAMQAIDALRSWPYLQTEKGAATLARIFNDLLIPQGDWANDSYGRYYGNMNASHVYPDQMALARLTNDPERMHAVMAEMDKFMENRFLYDGHWYETSPSYARQVQGGLGRIAAIVHGYSDPEGYKDPATGTRFDNIDLSASAAFRALDDTLELSRFPNGNLIPLNDTWATSRPFGPRGNMEPILLPGLGVGILGQGAGDQQLHAYLSFTSGTAHKQNDALSIGLFALDHELLPTIGYTHTRYRRWARSQMSHNGVVVNGTESRPDGKHIGNVAEVFYTDPADGLQIVSARSDTAYPVSEYRRALLLIGTPEESPYLLDIFAVAGGKQHDYLLHGSRDADTSLELPGISLAPFDGTLMNPGTYFIPPKSERDNAGGNDSGYGFVSDLSVGTPNQGQTEIIIRLDDNSGRKLRTVLETDAADKIYTGKSPSIRRAGGRHFKENEALLDTYLSPLFALRRQGNNLESFFVATHEPLQNKTGAVESVSSSRQGQTRLIRIGLGDGRTDYILFAPGGDSQKFQTADGEIDFSGRYALIRTKGGKAERSWLIGGDSLSLGGDSLAKGKTEYTGPITGYGTAQTLGKRGYIDIGETLPQGEYSTLHLQFPDKSERSFTIVSIDTENDGKGSRIHVRENPGFERKNGQIKLTTFPQRTIGSGDINYRIYRTQKHAATASANQTQTLKEHK